MTLDEEIAATQKKLDALLARKKERFTPGPWFIDGLDRSIYAIDSRGVVICGSVRTYEDARLIREAPGMFEIVERIAAIGKATGETICEAAKIVQRVNG